MALREHLRRPLLFLSNEALLLLLLLMVVFRAVLMDFRLHPLSSCRGCVALLTARHDATVLGIVLVAFGLAHLVRRPALRASLRALASAVIIAYGLDLLIGVLYNMRLVVEDFFKYGREIGGVLSIAKSMIGTPAGIATLAVMVVLVGLITAFVRSRPRLDRAGGRYTLLAGLVLFVIGLVPSRAEFANAWAYRNLFEVNFDRSALASYNDDYTASLRAGHWDLRTGAACTARPAARPDVLLVVLEGFSMYHSRFFSGLADLTPNLDRIAARHTAFTRFHANGFTTENGLISLIGGQVPTPAVDQLMFAGGYAFEGFFDLPGSLPRLFGEHGYQAAFLTTGDLSFSGKGAWLQQLGFDEVRGHDDSFYDGWPRMHFSAAPDSALYLRARRWLEERPRDRPFFLVVETVSSHHPFIDPVTHQESEPAAFAYADRQLGLFYDELVATGVLDSGLLVVASDHRTMTPLRADELQRFGDEARSLVPFVIVEPGRREPRRVDVPFQQVDLATSIEAMLTGRSCPSAVRGDLFADPPAPPRCVTYTRADDRGRVSLVCASERADVRLHGAATHVESGGVPGQAQLVDQINFERIERLANRRSNRR